MRVRRETVEHPFGTLKMRMGATHFLMKRLPKVATEMALHVLAYNLTRVMNILGVKPLIAGDPDVRGGHRGAHRATRSLTADRANHVDSSSQLRQHAKLSLASPVSPRPKRFHTTKTHTDKLRTSLRRLESVPLSLRSHLCLWIPGSRSQPTPPKDDFELSAVARG
jgi:hypothetical protein